MWNLRKETVDDWSRWEGLSRSEWGMSFHRDTVSFPAAKSQPACLQNWINMQCYYREYVQGATLGIPTPVFLVLCFLLLAVVHLISRKWIRLLQMPTHFPPPSKAFVVLWSFNRFIADYLIFRNDTVNLLHLPPSSSCGPLAVPRVAMTRNCIHAAIHCTEDSNKAEFGWWWEGRGKGRAGRTGRWCYS